MGAAEQAEAPFAARAKLRKRARRLAHRARVWAPFDRMMPLVGVRAENGEVVTSREHMNDEIRAHW
eukprot:4330067-Pyramimonas_sp.AAC.1